MFLGATGKEEEEEDACVGRRGIYRDVYNVKVCAEDFALRPNFVVAIAEVCLLCSVRLITLKTLVKDFPFLEP